MRTIREKYGRPEQNNEIEWYCDLSENGDPINMSAVAARTAPPLRWSSIVVRSVTQLNACLSA
jgi:hypothetical protein